MRPRRWAAASAVIALGLTLITIRSLDAPLFLYPSSASLPPGIYVRSFEQVRPGMIVAFAAPDGARHYQEGGGTRITAGYLFMKPIIAGSGDRVCNSLAHGLEINGVWIAPVAQADSHGRRLPIWRSCRQLRSDEFFMFSNFAPNSFDSRYYGTLQSHRILGTYRQFL